MQVVRRGETTHADVAENGLTTKDVDRAAQHFEEEGVRGREGELHRIIVYHFQGSTAINIEEGRTDRHQVFVHVHVFKPEHDVVGRKRCAIRPLGTFTQEEGDLGAVFVDFPAFGQVRHHFGEVL